MNYEQKHPILQKLEEYFKNTPKEQIDKDWSNILKDTDSEAYYKKKYQDALKKARYYHSKGYMLINNAIENIFPELQESENEQIKKEIIRILKVETRYTSKEDADKYITWLEKRGKQIDPDKVIEWLNHRELSCDDVVTTVIPDDSPTSVRHKVRWLSDDFINKFKKDFKL